MPFIYEGNKKWFNAEPRGTPFLKYESSALTLDQSEAGQGPNSVLHLGSGSFSCV